MNPTKINMSYFKGKVTALRNEYTDPDKKQVIAQRGGKCELCGKEDGEKAVFGPTHYIKRHIIFKTHIHIHVIAYHGQIHKICICDSCHLGYHLFNRLDQDAYLGNRRIGDSFDKPKKKRIVHVIKKRKKRVDSRK